MAGMSPAPMLPSDGGSATCEGTVVDALGRLVDGLCVPLSPSLPLSLSDSVGRTGLVTKTLDTLRWCAHDSNGD